MKFLRKIMCELKGMYESRVQEFYGVERFAWIGIFFSRRWWWWGKTPSLGGAVTW